MVTYCVTYLKHVFAPCLYSFSYPPPKGAAHLNCLCKEDLSLLGSKSNEVPSRSGSKKFNRTLLCWSRQFPLKFTLLNLERSINAECHHCQNSFKIYFQSETRPSNSKWPSFNHVLLYTIQKSKNYKSFEQFF